MPDYAQSKIYKIVDNTNNNIYIGSTVIELEKRLHKHITDYNWYLNGKMNFISSFDILKNSNYCIELIELYPCNTRVELLQKENEYITNNKCINRYHSCSNPDRIKKQNKDSYEKYKLNNPEKMKEHYENRKKSKIECLVCKKLLGKQNIARHIKTQHKDFVL